MKITIASSTPTPTPATKDLVLGMQLVPITPALRQRFNLKPTVRGLIVDAVDTTGEAAKRGVRPADIIVEANQTVVESAGALRAAITATKKEGREFMLLRVNRGNDVVFITVSVK